MDAVRRDVWAGGAWGGAGRVLGLGVDVGVVAARECVDRDFLWRLGGVVGFLGVLARYLGASAYGIVFCVADLDDFAVRVLVGVIVGVVDVDW